MITHLVSRQTGERLSVELEIGGLWWLKDSAGRVQKVDRSRFTPSAWCMFGGDLSADAMGFGAAGAIAQGMTQ